MSNTIRFLPFMSIILCSTLLFSACNKDDEENGSTDQGDASIKMTDAPIDNANVEAVMVTVTEVKVDGETFQGFEGPQTIDLLSYQEGATKPLADGKLDVGSYNNISLILDYESDANGESPGCYVLTTENEKHKLSNASGAQGEFEAAGDFDIQASSQSNLVIDFDARKAVRAAEQAESNFKFATNSEMQAALRLVVEENTGNVAGNYNSGDESHDKVVVYAYEKGEFDQNTEMEPQGESGIMFKNAVTSTVVTNGEYNLAFLNAGDYELHFAAYDDTDNSGQTTFQGMLDVESEAEGKSVTDLTVEAGAELTLDIGLIVF